MFDGAEYLQANPDVAARGLDPQYHYARHGWLEGRDTGSRFDVAAYLGRHPELIGAGVDPLLHFVRHGGSDAVGDRARARDQDIESAPVSNWTLVTYATSDWYQSRFRLVHSARAQGSAEPRVWTRADLVATPFYDRHPGVLDQARGSGFWLWKPFIILDALERAAPGEAVIYADAGIAFTADPTPLIELCRREGGILLFAGHYEDDPVPGPNVNSRWTKRDCFVRLGADEPRFHGAVQADASLMVFIRNERSLAFVRRFLESCEDPAVLSDDPNVCGLPNLPDFIDHRHDQSVLSVLAAIDDLPLHRHPSQKGNHLKAPAERVADEWLRLPYVSAPWPDRYPTLVDHHRERSDRVPLVRADEVADAMRRDRAALDHVPRWVSDETYDGAIAGYGLPASVKNLIDRDLGDEPTYTDLLVHEATHLRSPVRYLEIGTSVGKNLYQLLSALRSAHLVALDLEDVSPVLRSFLGEQVKRLDTWPTPAGSLRSAAAYLDSYPDALGSNVVDYLCADEWDDEAWARLSGRHFNLILSDAEHSPEAIRHEASMLLRHDLLDPTGFIMVWDDLGDTRTDAFIDTWERIRDRYALPDRSLRMGMIRGWLGVNEPPHLVGLVDAIEPASA